MNYRVELVDKDTGARHFLSVFNADTGEEAMRKARIRFAALLASMQTGKFSTEATPVGLTKEA